MFQHEFFAAAGEQSQTDAPADAHNGAVVAERAVRERDFEAPHRPEVAVFDIGGQAAFKVMHAQVFFAFAFYRLYRSQEACAPNEVCAVPAVRSRQRMIFWVVSAFAAALIVFPLYAPLFF